MPFILNSTLTSGYDLYTGSLVAYVYVFPLESGHVRPESTQPSVCGGGNGTGIPPIMPCTTTFALLTSSSAINQL